MCCIISAARTAVQLQPAAAPLLPKIETPDAHKPTNILLGHIWFIPGSFPVFHSP
jgi:hypothetical protein